MKKTLSTSEAADLLLADMAGGWSREGALALIEHLVALEEDIGVEMEFDAVAIRCDYSEYPSAVVALLDNGGPEEDEAGAVRWLCNRTTVIGFLNGVIVQAF